MIVCLNNCTLITYTAIYQVEISASEKISGEGWSEVELVVFLASYLPAVQFANCEGVFAFCCFCYSSEFLFAGGGQSTLTLAVQLLGFFCSGNVDYVADNSQVAVLAVFFLDDASAHGF